MKSKLHRDAFVWTVRSRAAAKPPRGGSPGAALYGSPTHRSGATQEGHSHHPHAHPKSVEDGPPEVVDSCVRGPVQSFVSGLLMASGTEVLSRDQHRGQVTKSSAFNAKRSAAMLIGKASFSNIVVAHDSFREHLVRPPCQIAQCRRPHPTQKKQQAVCHPSALGS